LSALRQAQPWRVRLEAFARRGLWSRELEGLVWYRALPLRLLRSLMLTLVRGREHELGIRAAALTYTTVLSLVPLLAFAFALAKGFGLYDRLIADVVEPFLEQNFGPAGSAGEPAQSGMAGADSGLRQAAETVLEIVQATPVTGLGVFGLSVLLAAVVRLLTQVELAINRVHGVLRPRPLLRRVLDYLAILTVAPALALAATAAKASSQSQRVLDLVHSVDGIGFLLDLLLSIGPLLVMAGLFSALYALLPNRPVRIASALLGGVIAALLWSLVQELYVGAQLGVNSYNRLYAGFAALPLFLFWLYLSWGSVLLGAEVAASDQSQEHYRHQRLYAGADQAAYEAAVLGALLRLAAPFEAGQRPPSLAQLVDALDVPHERLLADFERLERAGFLLRAEGPGGLCFALGRPADRILLADLLFALRGRAPEPAGPAVSELDRRLWQALLGLEAALPAHPSNLDLRRLLAEVGPAPAPRGAGAQPALRR
jgi:membrane protein